LKLLRHLGGRSLIFIYGRVQKLDVPKRPNSWSLVEAIEYLGGIEV
jgi:hypothetical protein